MDASSPSAEQLEVARALWRRAAGDLKVAQKIAPDPEIDEAAIGFHAQQAVEKAVKSALTLEGIDFPRSHDIDFLVELAEDGSRDVPADVAGAGWLTPWAAELRYDEEPLDALDKERAIDVAREAVGWCEELLAEAQLDQEKGGSAPGS